METLELVVCHKLLASSTSSPLLSLQSLLQAIHTVEEGLEVERTRLQAALQRLHAGSEAVGGFYLVLVCSWVQLWTGSW